MGRVRARDYTRTIGGVVGALVGVELGALLGWGLGAGDGTDVGVELGAVVRLSVSRGDGATIGGSDGAGVGKNVGLEVSAEVPSLAHVKSLHSTKAVVLFAIESRETKAIVRAAERARGAPMTHCRRAVT